MDYQGKPGSGTGQKVTTDPRSNDFIDESTGPVAKDSLAAESYRQGGGFSDNRDANPSDVSGSSSTWNNTDTSGASTLDSAPSASRRQGDDSGSSKYPEAVGGQGNFSGRHNDGSGGYAGGPSNASSAFGSSGSGGSGGYGTSQGETGSYSASGADSYDTGSSAPNYTLNQQGAFQGSKAKGTDITEGGFTGEGSNFNSGIGTRDDPGRAALQGIANNSVRVESSGAYQGGRAGNEQPFDALGNNERA